MKPSQFLELARGRASVRRYDPRPVPREEVLSCIEAARLAPSAENLQPCRYVAAHDPAVRDRLARACFSGIYLPTRFAAKAPVLVAICAGRFRPIQGKASDLVDCGIAGEHFVLRAAELGLGTCWIEWFDRAGARRALGVPRSHRVIALVAMGYPQAGLPARERVRKPLSAIAWLDGWGKPWPGA